MKLELTFNNTKTFLQVCVTGLWNTESAEDALMRITNKAKALNQQHILIDIRKLSNPGAVERFYTGELVAKYFGPPEILKVAAVWNELNIDKFIENIAVNQGAYFIVLGDLDKAVQWLEHEQ